MDRWRGKVAVVTGASAGIGAAISIKLVENGVQVVGLARRLDRLLELEKKLGGGKFHPLRADVTKETDVIAAFDWVKEKFGGLHILVNNAGIAKPAGLLDGATSLFKEVLDTNILALTVVTREGVKLMGGDGHVIHINSIAGHRVSSVPLMNVYFASKHAVTALAETLRLELARAGREIRVTSLSPGLVDTDIVKGFSVDERLQKAIELAPKLLPEDVADAVLYVLGTPQRVQVSEIMLRPTGSME